MASFTDFNAVNLNQFIMLDMNTPRSVNDVLDQYICLDLDYRHKSLR